MSRVVFVLGKNAGGMEVLKPSAVVIHLRWSSAARLRWIREQRGDLQGMCLVITSVFGCAEVSDRHSAAGGHNLVGFVCF